MGRVFQIMEVIWQLCQLLTRKVVCVQGTPCDLITGDERRCVSDDGVTASAHIACTVEMTNVSTPCNYLFVMIVSLFHFTTQGYLPTHDQ